MGMKAAATQIVRTTITATLKRKPGCSHRPGFNLDDIFNSPVIREHNHTKLQQAITFGHQKYLYLLFHVGTSVTKSVSAVLLSLQPENKSKLSFPIGRQARICE
jgi:hypothetical protein